MVGVVVVGGVVVVAAAVGKAVVVIVAVVVGIAAVVLVAVVEAVVVVVAVAVVGCHIKRLHSFLAHCQLSLLTPTSISAPRRILLLSLVFSSFLLPSALAPALSFSHPFSTVLSLPPAHSLPPSNVPSLPIAPLSPLSLVYFRSRRRRRCRCHLSHPLFRMWCALTESNLTNLIRLI